MQKSRMSLRYITSLRYSIHYFRNMFYFKTNFLFPLYLQNYKKQVLSQIESIFLHQFMPQTIS